MVSPTNNSRSRQIAPPPRGEALFLPDASAMASEEAIGPAICGIGAVLMRIRLRRGAAGVTS